MTMGKTCHRCGISLDIMDLLDDQDEELCNECLHAEWKAENKQLNREYERSLFE